MLNKRKNRYDSFLIWLYSKEKEHLIQSYIRDVIPHSTASDWRKINIESFIGHEIRQIQESAINQYELYEKHQNLKRVVWTITKVWLAVAPIMLRVLHCNHKYSEMLINQIQQLFIVLPKSIVLKIARISSSAYYSRLNKLKVQCGTSPLQRCLKRHPLQLSLDEVRKIKLLFEDINLACWPASSIYYEGLRRRGLFLSMSTFYKYVNLLGLKRYWKKKQCKTKGIEALSPNVYLHVDTTFWTMTNHTKASIVFVSDNFSRVILGWSLSIQHGAVNVKKALTMAIKTIRRHYPNLVCSTLVTDGGSENHAVSISELLRKTNSPTITKIIAQKDISFSNSPVEAINRIMKRYLRHYAADNYNSLEKILEKSISDYNEIRPHGSLEGLTPVEAYLAPDKSLDFREEKRKARALRIVVNSQTNCTICL